MKNGFRIAAAAVAAALAAPVLASDPTQPEVTNPAPAIALHGSGRAEAEALSADPTQPRVAIAAPAMAVRSFGNDVAAGAIANDEPMASALREAPATRRVASK
jgi:hypothetical protein